MDKDEDDKTLNGPKHGDPLNQPEPEEPDGDEGEGEGEGEKEKKPVGDPVEFMREQLRSVQAELRELRGRSDPKPAERKKEAEPEPDWDKMLFDKPGEAVKELRKRIKDEIREELTGQYTADRNQQQFWSGFYEKNPDLKNDRDLVQMTLTANMKELGDMKVEDAAERLGELTRERILRYAKNTNTNGGKKKPQAEGANPPGPRKKTPEPAKPVTLSEIIKSRRAAHNAPPSTGNRGSAA